MFLALSAAAVALSLVFVLLPLLRTDPRARRLRRRIAALDDLQEDLPADDWTSRRERLVRELAECGEARTTRYRLIAVLLVVLVPLAVIVLYQNAGTPAALEPADSQSVELREMLGELTAAVKRDPEDLDAWTRLGLIWKNLQQFSAAEAAWRRILFLEPDDGFARVELAETLLFASGQTSMPTESRQLLDEALKDDPNNQKALWLSGMAEFQQGRAEQALVFWERLDRLLPQGGVREQVRQQIDRARADLGRPPATPERAAPDPGAQERQTGGPELVLEIDIEPALRDLLDGDETLFVFARAQQGPPAPLAVVRMPAASLPTTVTLSDADSMAQGLALSNFDTWEVVARVSISGDVTAAAGDLQGQRSGVDSNTEQPVSIRIDSRIE